MQAAQKGKAHMEFEKIIDELPDATVIRIRLLGRNIILLADPTAAEELLRRNKFVPKLLPAYQGFYFLVRTIWTGRLRAWRQASWRPCSGQRTSRWCFAGSLVFLRTSQVVSDHDQPHLYSCTTFPPTTRTLLHDANS